MEPMEANIQQWVAEIGAVLNLKLRYSPLLRQRLADHYKHYVRCLKIKKGHGRAQYCSQAWTDPLKMLIWILPSFNSKRQSSHSVHFGEGALRQCGLIEKEQNGI